MYTNDLMVLQLVSLLKQFGIKRIVVSPGSRHNKLIRSLEFDNYFRLYIVVDERSAAFFALGLIQQFDEPVAITCSSGTACINYGSAVVEAFYQKLPLLVLSSDRIPELLNQNEDQMYAQASTFREFTKYSCQLPVIDKPIDEWFCNRLLNEALLELENHGRGPVHINIPFAAHHGANFDVKELPVARKINLNTLPFTKEKWDYFYNYIKNKKILLIWGQAVYPLQNVSMAEELFSEKYQSVVFTDKISNCHVPNSINNVSITLDILNRKQNIELQPDIVITIGGNYIFNGEIKAWLKKGNSEHWLVGREGKVCDPFQTLKQIFEMPEDYFFKCMAEAAMEKKSNKYAEEWIALSKVPKDVSQPFNELYAISTLLKQMPANADLQLANSQTIRMAHLVPISNGIRVFCNRGVNGIDGSMSTAIGYGAESSKKVFYITGELSFFYDMNSLSIKHLSPKMRILLINNEGGAVMYDQKRNTPTNELPIYLAAGRSLTAKGWAESLGIMYISATSKDEADQGIKILLEDNRDCPILLEVFTDLSNDKYSILDHKLYQDERSLRQKVEDKIFDILNL